MKNRTVRRRLTSAAWKFAALAWLAAGASAQTTLLDANFDNNSNSGWQTFVSGWLAEGGVYKATNTGANIRTESVWGGGYSWTDYTVSAAVNMQDSHAPSAAELDFRYQDASRYGSCRFMVDISETRLELIDMQTGLLASTKFAAKVGQWYTLQATITGTTATCSVVGTSASISGQYRGTATGTVGLRNAHIPVWYDNVKVVGSGGSTTAPLTITSSTLGGGTANLGYSGTLVASGGKTPYTWSATGLPSGLTLNSSSGVLNGTPTSAGTFTVNVTVTDSSSPKLSASKAFSLTIASGGGSTSGLAVNINQVIDGGCPNNKLIVSVTSSQGAVTSLTSSNFSVKESGRACGVSVTPATSSTSGPLSLAILIDVSGSVGTDLASEKAAAKQLISQTSASDAVAVYSFTDDVRLLQDFTSDKTKLNAAVDAAAGNGQTALYDAVLIAAKALGARTGRRAMVLMTDGEDSGYGVSIDQAIAAAKAGNVPIFTVGFSTGINTTILGKLAGDTGGSFSQSATATDLQRMLQSIGQAISSQYELAYTSLNAGADNSVEVTVSYAGQTATATRTVSKCAAAVVTPALTLSSSSTQITSITTQPTIALTLGSAAAADINVTLGLAFMHNAAGLPANYANPGLRFASGGTTATLTVPRGSVNASLSAGNAIQVGSVAGTITVKVTSITQTVNGQTQTLTLPSPAPYTTITVARTAPVITAVRLINVTSSGFTVDIMASSTPRDLSSANFTFFPSGNGQLNGTNFTVSLSGAASSWFSGASGQSNGGGFNLQVPFTYSGDPGALGSVSVQLVNSAGTSSSASGTI